MTAGKWTVIIFVIASIATAIAATILIARGGVAVVSNQAGVGLAKTQKAAAVWAEDNQGNYPKNVALLQANNYFRASLLNDPRQPSGSVWTVGNTDARPFLDEIRRESNKHTRLDRSPLIEAVESNSNEPIYRFGDYWFVRLDRYRNEPFLIYGWTLADDEGQRFLVFDDGNAMRVSIDDWAKAWKNDAEARERLGMPPLDMPNVDDPQYQFVPASTD